MPSISSVAIVGGTHGNELTGIHLINNLAGGIHSLPDSLDYSFLIANPDAVAANTRFIDVDLNRQFTLNNLAYQANSLYELNLAQTINRKIGPKDNPRTDLVIDIHNTTSHMGATLIVLESNDFYRNMAAYLKQHMPSAHILVEDEVSYLEHPYLCTCGRYGIMLELGAQPQGVCRADIYAPMNPAAPVTNAVFILPPKNVLDQRLSNSRLPYGFRLTNCDKLDIKPAVEFSMFVVNQKQRHTAHHRNKVLYQVRFP